MWEHLLDFLLASITLGIPTAAAAAWLTGRDWCDRFLVVIGAMACTCLVSYAAFWLWFARPAAGYAWTVAVLLASVAIIWQRRAPLLAALRDDDVRVPWLLALLAGLFYIGLLHLFETPLNVDKLSAMRYMLAMPVDNELPRAFAQRLIFGNSPRHLYDSWLSSDRPPLQVGVICFAYPILKWGGAPLLSAAHAIGMWFQLLWVPAVWALARRLGFTVRLAAVLCAITVMTSLTMFHSIYLWPKLGGGGLAVAAYAIYAPAHRRSVPAMMFAAMFGALAWLSHGGTIFSVLALAAMAVVWPPWPSLAAVVAAAATFVTLAAPWTAYQKLYDPPGDRLIKWHIGGVVDVDSRGAVQLIRDQYRAAGVAGTIFNKKANFLTLVGGYDEYTFDMSQPRERRVKEWYYFFRSFGIWILALPLAPIAWLRRRRAGLATDVLWTTTAWTFLTLIVWCLVAFGPPTYTINHAGPFSLHLTMYVVMYALAWSVSPWIFATLATVHLVTTAITWLPTDLELANFPLSPQAIAVSIVTGLAIAAVVVWQCRAPAARPSE